MNSNYSPQIETFPRLVGSSQTIIGVDLHLEDQIPIEELPWVNSLQVSASSPSASADSDSGEDQDGEHFPARSGFEIEKQLFMPLVTGHPKNAMLVGSVSTLRSAEWFIYSAEPLAERFEAAIKDQFPELNVEARAQHDEEWSVYREFLRPSQIERLLIQNRRKVRESEQADAAGQKKQVDEDQMIDHTVWFTSPDDRNAFAEIVAERGFELHYPEQDVPLETSEGDTEYGLTVTREEHLDIETMDELTRWLFKLASRLGGEYEGWHAQH
jgi:regulator of RNase E activity RraB